MTTTRVLDNQLQQHFTTKISQQNHVLDPPFLPFHVSLSHTVPELLE